MNAGCGSTPPHPDRPVIPIFTSPAHSTTPVSTLVAKSIATSLLDGGTGITAAEILPPMILAEVDSFGSTMLIHPTAPGGQSVKSRVMTCFEHEIFPAPVAQARSSLSAMVSGVKNVAMRLLSPRQALPPSPEPDHAASPCRIPPAGTGPRPDIAATILQRLRESVSGPGTIWARDTI